MVPEIHMCKFKTYCTCPKAGLCQIQLLVTFPLFIFKCELKHQPAWAALSGGKTNVGGKLALTYLNVEN
ncbi:MAG: hypothetical protein JWO06_1277 [Bacteroidota bacterium]|nr:hypothetical protein [Bacteroidota bacterium]